MTGRGCHGGWHGTAFLAIANTVDPAVRAEYEAWHTFEHVPERLTMPGFVGGRRFTRETGRNRHYLTLYDLDDAAALETPDYHRLLAHPTPASRLMRPRMGGFERVLYRETARCGHGCGRHLGVLRWRIDKAGENPAGIGFAALAGQDGIVSVRLGASVETAPHPAFAPDPAPPVEQAAALLSGTGRAAMADILATVEAGLTGAVLACDVYDLIVAY